MIERYSRKEIKNIWEDYNKYSIWLDIELAAAEAMEKLKIIPKGIVKKVTDIMNSGGLVSDQIIIELILDRIDQDDCVNGFLFDGGIRTVGQADLCVENSIEFTHVIEIKVDDDVIVDRMSGRRVHPGSGRNYHLVYQPPKNEGVDDITGEPLIQREDDMPETVKHRLQVYQDETKPLVAYYQDQESKSSLKYIAVDGSQPVEKVFEDIEQNF